MDFRYLQLGLALLATTGCFGSPNYQSRMEAAYRTVDQGIAAYNEGDANQAFELLTNALKSGGIGQERMYQACRYRAICAAKLGDFSTAEQDLITMEEVAVSFADVLAVRSYVLQKRGQSSQARAALKAARRIDRTTEEIQF